MSFINYSGKKCSVKYFFLFIKIDKVIKWFIRNYLFISSLWIWVYAKKK